MGDVFALFDVTETSHEELSRKLKEIKTSFDAFSKDAVMVQEYKGYRIIPNFSISAIEYLLTSWKARSGDVIIASFPKTGTNWTMEIVRHILFRDTKTFHNLKKLPLAMQFLETGNPEKFATIDMLRGRRLFFTHLASDLVNHQQMQQVGAKVIYVLRNPKDQMVSWYHFYQKLPKSRNEPVRGMLYNGWDNFVENYLNGRFSWHLKPGEWYPDHILSWFKLLENKFVYFLYYEDLQKNLTSEINKLAAFLEVEISPDVAKSIGESCSIETMKSDVEATRDGQLQQAHSVILRTGKVGDWRNYFSHEQSKKIDEIFQSKLQGTNIRFSFG